MSNTRDMADIEKANASSNTGMSNGSGPYHLDQSTDSDTALRRIRTAGSISISPELFEKIYLSPKNRVSGDIRSTFANPTPLCIVGFIMSLTPLSNALLGWQGSGGLGGAQVGVFYFFGGMLMTLGALLEFVLGNTFPFIVFGSFGGFWFTYGATLTPAFAATVISTTNPSFQATFAFFLLYMGLLCIVFLVCSLRTNICFFLIFLTLIIAFGCLAGSFWHASKGNASLALTLQHAGGGSAFVTTMFGWYLLFVQLLASVDFPLSLPVGDLSGLIKGASEKVKSQ